MGLLDFLRKREPNSFAMTETMWGYVSEGASSFKEGYEKGKAGGNKLEYAVTMQVDNFKEFAVPSGRKAAMTGHMSCKNLYGERLAIRDGEYGLYLVDPDTGQRRITYIFKFTPNDGREYQFSGYKVIVHEPWSADLLEDQTTLYATITRLDSKEIVARGIIHYHVEDFAEMLASIRVPEDDTLANRAIMANRFFAFVSKEVSEYTGELSACYRADYSNLVVSGFAASAGSEAEFFLFSGAHDRGFPWGDNVSFADIGLVVRVGPAWRRFALTERAIDGLDLLVSEGAFRYEGPLYEIIDGYQVSFRELHQEGVSAGVSSRLRKVDAKIALEFASTKIDTKRIPISLDREKAKQLSGDLGKQITESGILKHFKEQEQSYPGLGYTVAIHRLRDVKGDLVVGGTRYAVTAQRTIGEGEFGTIVGLRRPRLYYNYFCALEPTADQFRIQVRSGVLATLSSDLLVNATEQVLGDVIGQVSRMDLVVTGGRSEDIVAEDRDRLMIPAEDVLEINNDHFPTATFQRRVVVLPGLGGGLALALEEDMSVINLEPIASDQSATVAAVSDPDRFEALDRVLESTRFFTLLDDAQKRSGKSKDQFSVVVKPNFSFMYSLTDISTFTDPKLVEHLIDRMHERGYRNLAVAEAQSTYAVLFTNRDVPTLAKYIGLSGRNYKIVDLSENTVPHDFGKTLGRHEVHPAWRDADFRISFAKNKTHSYAFYTLTIKNIYGALPRRNKFKEYHCNDKMGIYAPAIDFIEAFPIHYGLIDAYFSADGPFGIFADSEPNFTSTVIGGDSVVAVDWVGASKMGYDPMISDYMKMAVERFGKPRITLVGNHSTYRGWRNVPDIISKTAFGIMDRNYLFGNFLYSVMGTMDPFFTFKPDEVSRRIGRLLSQPMRKVLFRWVHGSEEQLTPAHLRKMLDPKQQEYMKKLVESLFE